MRFLITLTTALALLLAGCGNDNDSADQAISTPTATAAVVVTAPPPLATPAPTPAPQEPVATPTPIPTAVIIEDSLDEADSETVPLDVPQPLDLSQPAFSSADKLSTIGLGAMYFGMTPEEAAEAIPTLWTGTDGEDTPRCYLLAPANGPSNVVVTVYNGRIERIDITNPDISTRSGARVGSTEAQLTELFGQKLIVTPHTDGTGNTIEFVPVDESDRDYRVTFETNGTTVTSMRAGRLPAVQPTNPCA
ncbi:MAG: hypothetical protein OXE93_07975 [bacterium]|nr:hypothetical protein [bacterium]